MPYILPMFLLFLCALVRPIVFRAVAVGRRSGDSCTILACWMFIGTFLLFPFHKDLLIDAWPTLEAKPWLAFVSIAKGGIIWLIVFGQQYMRKVSTSSAEFKGFPALALIALINVILLGEILSFAQWLSVLGLALLGLIYAWRGHLATLPKPYAWIFVALVVLGALPASSDVLVIGQTNWYVQFAFSSFGFLTGVLMNKRSRNFIKIAFTKRDCLIMGSTFLITEVIILVLLVTHIPVTIGALSMRLAVPSIILISSLLWHEGRWQSQLLFGVLAYLTLLPIFLF